VRLDSSFSPFGFSAAQASASGGFFCAHLLSGALCHDQDPGIPFVEGRNDYTDVDGKKYGIAIHNTSNNASDEAEASYATAAPTASPRISTLTRTA